MMFGSCLCSVLRGCTGFFPAFARVLARFFAPCYCPARVARVHVHTHAPLPLWEARTCPPVADIVVLTFVLGCHVASYVASSVSYKATPVFRGAAVVVVFCTLHLFVKALLKITPIYLQNMVLHLAILPL